jgi:cytidylate kinase
MDGMEGRDALDEGRRIQSEVPMFSSISPEKCFSFIHTQLQPNPQFPHAHAEAECKLAITISRQTGSGSLGIADSLARILQVRWPKERCQWTVFDRNLVEKVLEDHHLPGRLAGYMREDRVGTIHDMMTEILGLHPSSWDLFHQTTETILRLADVGHVILIGRGANMVTAKLPHVFHVRLSGSKERRLKRLQENLNLSPEAAEEFLEKTERGRERYLKDHFKSDINDPLLYHLVINTDRIECSQAAELIAEAAVRWAKTSAKPEHPAVLAAEPA